MQLLHTLSYRNKSSLRRRVRLGVSLILLITTIFVLGGTLGFVYHSEQAVWKARQAEMTSSVAQNTENYLERIFTMMLLTVNLEDPVVKGEEVSFNPMLTRSNMLTELVWLDQAGNIIARDYASETAPLLEAAEIDELLTIQMGQRYIGDLHLSPDGEPYVVVATSTPENGILVGRLNVSTLWDIVTDVTFGDTGHAYIVDASGTIVAHSDTDVVLNGTSIADRTEMTAALAALSAGDRSRYEGENRENQAGENNGGEAGDNSLPISSNEDISWRGRYTNFAGADVIGQAQSIMGWGWTIFVEMEQQEAISITRSALIVLGLGTVLLWIVTYSSSMTMLNRAILCRIDALRKGANRIGAGHLDERIAMTTDDEIGVLATAFNDMSMNLQQKITETEQLAIKATEANTFKGRMLARVSHELRNPLGGILGMSEILQTGGYGELNDRQHNLIDRVVKSTLYLNQLVDELLEQSRLEFNQISLNVTEFDPRAPLEAIVAINEGAATKKGVALITKFAPDLPGHVTADRGKIEQIVANLVGNAIKFTPEGTVTVSACGVDAAHWMIQVQDTGIGIPADARPFIFDAFRQVDEQITRQYGGFGLGLSIAKQLITLMNGSIDVISEAGQGSIFTVTLPISVTHDHNNQPNDSAIIADPALIYG